MKSIKTYLNNIDPCLLSLITGKTGVLIHAVRSNNFISEDALKEYICGESKPLEYYQNLKLRAMKMLQALAIVSVSKGASETKKKLDFCRKKITIGQKFLLKGEREEGFRLIKQAYKIAVKYDFVDFAAETSSVLFHQYLYYKRNIKTANFYEAQYNYYTKQYLIEKQTQHELHRIIGKAYKDSVPFKRILKKVEELKGESLKYHTYKSMICVLYGVEIFDYRLIINQSTSILKFLKDKKGVYNSHLQFFLSKLGLAQMAIGNNKNAENNFLEAQNYTHPKSINESILNLYRTINAIHAGEYQVAYDLYRRNRKCKFRNIAEQFAIIEAYLCFLSNMGYLSLERKFRIGKYLNDTFKAQSDKKGNNVNILIAELLVHLVRSRGKFIDRVEAINNYSYRYLKGENHKRAKRFTKILCLLPRANFNSIALKRLASKQVSYLIENPLQMRENIALEIIPFEDLLGMILQHLERKAA